MVNSYLSVNNALDRCGTCGLSAVEASISEASNVVSVVFFETPFGGCVVEFSVFTNTKSSEFSPQREATRCPRTQQTTTVGAMSSPAAVPVESQQVEVVTSENLPWMCIVWDDPVNLMSYVTYVFHTILGYDKKRAHELMMQVHTEGKAVVSTGEKDKVEGDVKKLHTAGLWATMQQAG